MLKKLLINIGLLLLLPAGVFAQDMSQSFAAHPALPNKILPSKFSFEIKPGGTGEDLVEVINLSDRQTSFVVSGVDESINDKGQRTFLLATDEQKAVGLWIEPELKELTLAPQEKKTFKFKVTVPENTPMGDYLGGVSVEAVNAGEIKQDGQVLRINLRMVNHVRIKVTDSPQPIEKTPVNQPYTTIYFFASLAAFLAFLVYLSLTQVKKHRAKKSASHQHKS